ncbi:MAG: hypothetical protein CVU63_03600 [Deltaproteobacteria bacterium HGW-Deltaproteobacteria-20]|jgi:hypothetical protein|nr:MAG: hypothetical protein CVU63_03600 [Deltaproteobacteria bacterium HGW-Deltaproteobacteria-20]
MRIATNLVWLSISTCVACSSLTRSAHADVSAPPITAQHPVVFEAPYKLGARATVRSANEAKAEAEAIARWNAGGRASPWHPHPRVIVDNVRVQGAISSAAVLRTARAKGYWPIRRCFDPALPDQPTLRGKVSVRLTVNASGKATRSAVVGKPTLTDPQVVACLRNGMRGITYPRTRRGNADVTLDVTVHPGDAPMKAVEDPPVSPGPGSVSLPVVQALVARHAGARIQQCYVDARQRVPGLWGRLVLRLDVAPNGGIREVVETDSTFPDLSTTRCAIEAIRGIGLPPLDHGDARIVLPIRFGAPGA